MRASFLKVASAIYRCNLIAAAVPFTLFREPDSNLSRISCSSRSSFDIFISWIPLPGFTTRDDGLEKNFFLPFNKWNEVAG